MKYYNIDEFEAGMLIEAINTDHTYKITKENVYEIIEIEQSHTHVSPIISFLNDDNKISSKIINHDLFPFDNYFKIL